MKLILIFSVFQDKIQILHNELGNLIVKGNLDLPIAIRKGIIECTKRPLYSLSNYISFQKNSQAHKTFFQT